MGVFFYTNSVALIEDIPLEEEYNTEGELRSAMDAGFQQVNDFISLALWRICKTSCDFEVLKNLNFSRQNVTIHFTFSIWWVFHFKSYENHVTFFKQVSLWWCQILIWMTHTLFYNFRMLWIVGSQRCYTWSHFVFPDNNFGWIAEPLIMFERHLHPPASFIVDFRHFIVEKHHNCFFEGIFCWTLVIMNFLYQ